MRHKTETIRPKEVNEEDYARYGNFYRIEAEKAVLRYPQYERDELIAEAWLTGVNVSNPKYTKKRIGYNIRDFVRHDLGLRRKDYPGTITGLIHQHVGGEDERDGSNIFFDLCRHYDDPGEKNTADREIVAYLMKRAKLTRTERSVLKLFLKGWTSTEIAEKRKKTLFSVCSLMYNIREKLKKVIVEYDVQW